MVMPLVNLGSPLRVVIAAGHETICEGIRAAVERAGFAVPEACTDGAAATAMAVRERAHLCVIAADLPGAGEAVAAIVSLPLAPKVVVLGSTPDDEQLFAVLGRGAAGYLLDGMEPARLAEELVSVVHGGTALAPAVAARLVEAVCSRRSFTPPAALTDREWEALRLVARGLTTMEIAARLHVSPTAVRRNVSSASRQIVAAQVRGQAGPVENGRRG
jgi:DNA-binding NarL/FixJ family response regulator